MKNKNLYIGLGVAALAVIGYLVYTKKKGATTDATTKSAEVETEEEVAETKSTEPSAPVQSADTLETLLAKNNISKQDFEKIDAYAREKASRVRTRGGNPQMKFAEEFATKNNLNFKGYKAVKEALFEIRKDEKKAMPKTKSAIESSVTKSNNPKKARATKEVEIVAESISIPNSKKARATKEVQIVAESISVPKGQETIAIESKGTPETRNPEVFQKALKDYDFTEKDYYIIENKRRELKRDKRRNPLSIKGGIGKELKDFALANKISIDDYYKVREVIMAADPIAAPSETLGSTAVPFMSDETDTFAFNFSF
jgi:hypothetical protein